MGRVGWGNGDVRKTFGRPLQKPNGVLEPLGSWATVMPKIKRNSWIKTKLGPGEKPGTIQIRGKIEKGECRSRMESHTGFGKKGQLERTKP